MKADVAVEGVAMSSGLSKTAPVAVGGAVYGFEVFGIPVPELVPLLTCFYMVVMISHALWKWFVEWKDRRDGGEKDEHH